ncbi:hypothetical protein NLJ89_g931 [Agrocybe chaxingu]|uniref:Uncharacterized protein n=1 Tax=Agrocybe chaxingu TaxID=84603 RepID=A0A9W8TE54_9AGAR|nr:hypothetical protein NLJ89_g931 [Agrocybe chaxingu]
MHDSSHIPSCLLLTLHHPPLPITMSSSIPSNESNPESQVQDKPATAVIDAVEEAAPDIHPAQIPELVVDKKHDVIDKSDEDASEGNDEDSDDDAFPVWKHGLPRGKLGSVVVGPKGNGTKGGGVRK